MKELKFGKDGRDQMIEGINVLCNAVGSTLGPRGRNVLIERDLKDPFVTKDGVSVAKEISLLNRFQNTAVQMVKEVASKTASEAGDGTTTSMVLAQAMINIGDNRIANYGKHVNVGKVKSGMDEACEFVVDFINNIATPIEDKESIKSIATISANSDEFIGELIANSFDEIGDDGVITCGNSNTTETYFENNGGMKLQRGLVNQFFCNNKEKLNSIYQDPYILLSSTPIKNILDIVPILNEVKSSGKPLVIISVSVAGEVLQSLIINKTKGVIDCGVIPAPSFGENSHHYLNDIAVLTGGKVFDASFGMKWNTFSIKDLGRAKEVQLDMHNTTIMGGYGSLEDIEKRANEIRQQISVQLELHPKEQLEERLAKLVGGVGIIRVGARSEIELREKRDRIEDALHAVECAIAEGVVPGEGTTLITAGKYLSNYILKLIEEKADEFRLLGLRIVLDSLSAPFYKIFENAGMEKNEISPYFEKIVNSDESIGFDVDSLEQIELMSKGIIDPAKVEKIAIRNATSIAGIFLTTECVITFSSEKEHIPNYMDGSNLI